jgi:hydroxyacylglutathione hydrolase
VRLTDRVYLVGSGSLGFGLTHRLDCHVYVVDGRTELALVDAGAGRAPELIIRRLEEEGLDTSKLRHLIFTHGHADHSGGGAALKRAAPHIVTYASEKVGQWLTEGNEVAISLDVARQAGAYPEDYRLEAVAVDESVREGDVLCIGDSYLTVFNTPGHADGHISLLLGSDEGKCLFSGDCLFFGGRVMLENTYDCNLQLLIQSLRKMRKLNVTALLPGHGSVALSHGQSHIETANEVLDKLLIPDQFVAAGSQPR